MKRFTKHMASFATRHGGLKGVAMAAMLFSAVSMKAAVGDIFSTKYNQYTVLTEAGEAGTVSVRAKSKGPLLLSIPNTVKNNGVTYTVTVIEDEAYKGCTNIITLPGKGLFIPNGVTTIGKSAFDGCTTLTGKLTIPNSVTTIGDNAF